MAVAMLGHHEPHKRSSSSSRESGGGGASRTSRGGGGGGGDKGDSASEGDEEGDIDEQPDSEASFTHSPTVDPFCFPDASGACPLHALLVANTDASVELSLRILKERNELIYQGHGRTARGSNPSGQSHASLRSAACAAFCILI